MKTYNLNDCYACLIKKYDDTNKKDWKFTRDFQFNKTFFFIEFANKKHGNVVMTFNQESKEDKYSCLTDYSLDRLKKS